MARPATSLLALALAAILALVAAPHPARAHTPVVNKATLKGKTAFTLTAAEGGGTVSLPSGEGNGVGDRLVAGWAMSADGHGHFPQRVACTVAGPADATRGVPNLCTLEVAFALGSVMSQGTLYDLNGVLSGDLAITGGTGAFKGLRGNEQLSYNTATNTGTAKFFVS